MDTVIDRQLDLNVGQPPTLDVQVTGSPSLSALQGAIAWEQRRSQWEPSRQSGAADQLHKSIRNKSKRVFDALSAAFLLTACLPLLGVCALALFVDSPGPIFYRQRRLGLRGELFSMWKLRTMCVDSERVLEQYLDQSIDARREWTASHKLTNDPRVTSLGRLMRKTSLDELPQLWNVLTGEMSLIGPRPIVMAEIEKYGTVISTYYSVRPGMTGLWQISGRSNMTYDERVALDERYVKQWSPALDATIFLKTFKVLIKADGAY